MHQSGHLPSLPPHTPHRLARWDPTTRSIIERAATSGKTATLQSNSRRFTSCSGLGYCGSRTAPATPRGVSTGLPGTPGSSHWSIPGSFPIFGKPPGTDPWVRDCNRDLDCDPQTPAATLSPSEFLNPPGPKGQKVQTSRQTPDSRLDTRDSGKTQTPDSAPRLDTLPEARRLRQANTITYLSGSPISALHSSRFVLAICLFFPHHLSHLQISTGDSWPVIPKGGKKVLVSIPSRDWLGPTPSQT